MSFPRDLSTFGCVSLLRLGANANECVRHSRSVLAPGGDTSEHVTVTDTRSINSPDPRNRAVGETVRRDWGG